MALVCRPALLIADSDHALDVTIRRRFCAHPTCSRSSMAVLLITHDLGVLANI
jgi:ABC-type dipeptide/oligopeptide/nickel transport system ATPase component